jgi:tetratricopeptide (TPR) repeat protein
MDGAAKPDFFISRTGADKGAAELIAGIVREAGLTPFYQDQDFGHADFMRMMERGFETAAKLIVLLSKEYQESEYCRKEYNTFLRRDPGNLDQRVIVLRVGECEATGNLSTLASTNLVPVLNDHGKLRRVVRVALGIDRRPTEMAFAQAYARAGHQILHPEIKPLKSFTGREDLLEALGTKLAAKSSVAIRNSTQTSLALRGMGGVGKTVLAKEYAWRNRERYYGVWWIRAETRETLVDDLVALGSHFLPGLADMKPEDAAHLTVDRLAQMQAGKPWLLIFDNVDDPTPLRRFTPGDNAHVLITTRRTDWQDETDAQLAVDVFDRETAIGFLLKHAVRGEREAAGRLADALDCLPLALSHARSYCWGRHWEFAKYIAKLPELIAKAPKDAAYPSSVFATFSLAIEKATADCVEAETLMALLAFFAPDQIPLWLIPEDALTETQLGDALAALNAVSLVTFDNLSDDTPAVSVHRLVQEVMRGRLRAAGQSEVMAAQAIALLYRAYDHDSETVEIMQRRAAWLPHALTAPDFAPKEGGEAGYVTWLFNFAGDFRLTRGETSAAVEAYRKGQDIAERLAKADAGNAGWQRDLSVSYNKVGDVLRAQGDLQGALAAYKDSLAIRERLAKADAGNAGWQRDLSVSYEKVGDVLRAQGDLQGALAAYKDSLAIRERLAKADAGNAGWQRDVAMSYERLILIYLETGEKAKAAQMLADGRKIMARLTALSPDNVTWRKDLAWFDHYIAAQETASKPAASSSETREKRKRGLFARLLRRGL